MKNRLKLNFDATMDVNGEIFKKIKFKLYLGRRGK